jgi:hypothetical protein
MFFYYLCAVFTAVSAAVSFGFSVEAYVKSKPRGGAALTNAKYAVSRSAALFLAAIGLPVFINAQYLTVMSALMVCVQLSDGIVGFKISVFKTVGPILTAIGNVVLLILFLWHG